VHESLSLTSSPGDGLSELFGARSCRDLPGGVNTTGGAAAIARSGYWKGETSESPNPKDGFGMKQGREDVGGTKRQEVEKTCRRSTAK
jgi:hypothetical protein